MIYSDLQRSLVRVLLDQVRAQADKPISWLTSEINCSEAVLDVFEKQLHRFGQVPIANSSVSAVIRGQQKPSDDTMQIYIAFLDERRLFDFTEFTDLNPQVLSSDRPLSRPGRIKRGVFPISAGFADTINADRFRDFRYLYLNETDTIRHVAVLRIVHYVRHLNENDQRLSQRCDRADCDSRAGYKGYLVPLNGDYRLEVSSESSVPTRLYRADLRVFEPEAAVDKVELNFASDFSDGVLSRITAIPGERDAPILTKSVRNNMMVVQDRFVFPEASTKNVHETGGDALGNKEFMIANTEQDSRLLSAARNGNPREMALALVDGANINAREVATGASPLHLIALHGKLSLYEVLDFSTEAHAEILQDLASAGITDLDSASRSLRQAQDDLDAAVIDNNALFPSEYCPQASVEELKQSPVLQAHWEIYSRITLLEWNALESKGLNRGMNKGFDYQERAAAFGLDFPDFSPDGPA